MAPIKISTPSDEYTSNLNETEQINEEVPCLDAIPPTFPEEVKSLKSCIADRLRRHCAKSLAGPWNNSELVHIEEMTGGLSNYLYIAYLLSDETTDDNIPRKVFIRVYGELLRSNMNSVVLDAVIFALLSERRLAPKLYGVFSGGRLEEFIESRVLTTLEMGIPLVRDCLALHIASLHSLTMPLPKKPTSLFKMLAKFLQQLTGTRELSRRHLRKKNLTNSIQTSENSADQLADDSLLAPALSLQSSVLFGSTSSINSLPEPQANLFRLVNELNMVEEFDWLRSKLFCEGERFPVVFCHNDIQEQNILLFKDPENEGGYRLLPIDFEYCSYNFRGFDIGNYFNEWCYDNAHRTYPGFLHMPEKYPSRDVQIQFWRRYLSVYNNVRTRRSSNTFSTSFAELTLSESAYFPSYVNTNSDIAPELLVLTELDQLSKIPLIELDQRVEDELIVETTYGALFSHLWWSVWSLIQSEISSIHFGFIEYAKSRMEAYYNLKKQLPISEHDESFNSLSAGNSRSVSPVHNFNCHNGGSDGIQSDELIKK